MYCIENNVEEHTADSQLTGSHAIGRCWTHVSGLFINWNFKQVVLSSNWQKSADCLRVPVALVLVNGVSTI